MTVAFTASRTVPAAPETVWATLVDWTRAPEWMPGVTSARADGATAVGTVLHLVAGGRQLTSTVTALDPGRAITLSSDRPGVHADYRYELAPAAAGTAIALTADVTTAGPMKLLGGVIRGAIAKADGPQLDRLVALL